ncbi:hypothetical protein REPUB_Repub04eG0211700 [Reevesia pubescens]
MPVSSNAVPSLRNWMDKMVEKKSVGDVFAVHVCLLVLSRVSLDILFNLCSLQVLGRYPDIFIIRLLLWAPFLNFRKFPRDPSLKYPWDTPKDPSKVKNAYLRYPFAKPEDYYR